MPLLPGQLPGYRSGDLLARLTGDLEELENVYLRVFSPAVVAALATIACLRLRRVRPCAWPLRPRRSCSWAGLVCRCWPWLARGRAARQLALRAELHQGLVDGIQGMPDLLAFGRAADAERLAALERESGRLQRTMAWIDGLQRRSAISRPASP